MNICFFLNHVIRVTRGVPDYSNENIDFVTIDEWNISRLPDNKSDFKHFLLESNQLLNRYFGSLISCEDLSPHLYNTLSLRLTWMGELSSLNRYKELLLLL